MQRLSRPFRATRLLALVLLSLLGNACDLSTDAATAHTASINSGNGQTGPVSTAFPDPLSVIVVDQYGFVMENIQVTWAIRDGGGTLSASETKTNAQGIASVTYTAGPNAGISTITATIVGVGTLEFTETAT